MAGEKGEHLITKNYLLRYVVYKDYVVVKEHKTRSPRILVHEQRKFDSQIEGLEAAMFLS